MKNKKASGCEKSRSLFYFCPHIEFDKFNCVFFDYYKGIENYDQPCVIKSNPNLLELFFFGFRRKCLTEQV